MQLDHAVTRHAGDNITLPVTFNDLPALRAFWRRLGGIDHSAIILQLIRSTVYQTQVTPANELFGNVSRSFENMNQSDVQKYR